jgi:hypothetical protein
MSKSKRKPKNFDCTTCAETDKGNCNFDFCIQEDDFGSSDSFKVIENV